MRAAALDAALADAGASAFVHAGGDATVDYLAGAAVPCEAAVVYDGDTTLIPARSLPDWVDVPGRVTVLDSRPFPGERAAELVDGSVLAPREIPHDAALYLDRAGVDLASTDAHLRARARKTDAERAAIEDAQAAAEAGLAAVCSLLSGASADPLADDGGPVTAERAARAANAAMADAGANPAGNTVVLADGAQSAESDRLPAGDAALPATEPVAIRVAPRVRGYHGLLARTFVADSDGGWERRATLACERAIGMGVDVVESGGSTADEVAGEVTAELGSYGFSPAAASGDAYGVGRELREHPAGGDVLESGAVVALEPRLDDEAAVWLADLAVVTDSGAELVGSFPRSVVPRAD